MKFMLSLTIPSGKTVILYNAFISSEVVIFFQEVLFCRYKMIEDKLKISRYLSWTFCSCTSGMFNNQTWLGLSLSLSLSLMSVLCTPVCVRMCSFSCCLHRCMNSFVCCRCICDQVELYYYLSIDKEVHSEYLLN